MKTDPEFDTTSPAWGELCALAAELKPQFADSLRPCQEAMAAACKHRPDLAAAARKKPAISHARPQDALTQAVERMAADWRG